MQKDPKKVLQKVVQAIFDKKGTNILALDVKGISSLTDYVVIAEGSVDRHVKALAQEVLKILAEAEDLPIHVEGLQVGDWIVIDGSDYMIHLFMPGIRDKYSLEELFRKGKILEFPIRTAF